MIRSTWLLALSTCLALTSCRREETASPPPQPQPSRNAAPATPQDPNVKRPQTTSEIIHTWRLPEPGKYKCPQGYQLDIVPPKDERPGGPTFECRSLKDRSLPPKPVITSP